MRECLRQPGCGCGVSESPSLLRAKGLREPPTCLIMWPILLIGKLSLRGVKCFTQSHAAADSKPSTRIQASDNQSITKKCMLGLMKWNLK